MNEREIMNFNTGWLYSKSDYTNAYLAGFDDGSFDKVSLPHANTVLSEHKGGDFMAQIEKYRFVSWYRRHFAMPENFRGKRVSVNFEGVATVADVYVNGNFVGGHKGAYTGFSLDITDLLNFDGDNVIAVRVDSTKRQDVPPEGGDVDYCLFGGIVRGVTMTVTEKLYVENAFLKTPFSEHGGVKITCQADVKNDFDEDRLIKVETLLYDASGKEAARAISEEKCVPAHASVTVAHETAEIENPRLWSVDEPYLYTVHVNVLENGKITDAYKTRIGLRDIKFTDTGFFLNGKKLKLRGVNRHEQWPWQGRAVPAKLQIRDADLVKATGFNAVRCSHYPQAPAFLTRCDEIGLIVFEEAPGWQHVGDDAWRAIYKKNIEEMILRDRNHPSIVTWGVRVNESWDDNALYTETSALAKSLDPTRPTHGVRRNENYDSTEDIEDIFCANYQYPQTPRFSPFIVTEHSWEHWNDGFGLPQATDAQAAEFTKSFADVVNYYYGNELCLGGFAWSMFDYNNEVNYTRTGHVFYSGMYDIFRLDKPVSHFYSAQKAPNEGVELYIANYWTPGSPSNVEVYSNCDEVELFVNGNSAGRIRPNAYLNAPHPAFVFKNVEFEAGELSAVGYINGKEAAHAERKTPKNAARLALIPDYKSLTADGADMTSVTIELLDEDGTRLPYDGRKVNITVDGAAVFIGENPIELEGGRAAFLVRSRYGETGKAVCTASAEGVEDGKCEMSVNEYDDESVVPYSLGKGTVEPVKVSFC